MKFPSDYFELTEEYKNISAPDYTSYSSSTEDSRIVNGLSTLIVFLILWGTFGKSSKKAEKQKRGGYDISKPITIYYTPPKEDITIAAQIFHRTEVKITSALVYFRAAQGYIAIEANESGAWIFKTTAYTLHKSTNFSAAKGIHESLLKKMFKRESCAFALSGLDYDMFTTYKTTFKNLTKLQKGHYYTKKEKKRLGFIPYSTEVLNEE